MIIDNRFQNFTCNRCATNRPILDTSQREHFPLYKGVTMACFQSISNWVDDNDKLELILRLEEEQVMRQMILGKTQVYHLD